MQQVSFWDLGGRRGKLSYSGRQGEGPAAREETHPKGLVESPGQRVWVQEGAESEGVTPCTRALLGPRMVGKGGRNLNFLC